jgi:UDP-glucose 4-epimerase
MLLHVMKSPLKVEYGEARKVNGVTRRLASTWRAEQEIGFQAVVPFEMGLSRLVDWWRQSRESAVFA